MTRARNDVDLPLVVTVVMVAAVLIWVGVVALQAWFHGELRAEYGRKVIDRPVAELETRLAGQRALLESYKVVDAEAGTVRLPIERAMELVAAEQREEQR